MGSEMCIRDREKSLLNYCGLLGVAAFLSYTAAVVFSPLAYSGYDWMAQAVSDLSASNAPSLRLWNQLSSLYAKGVDGFVEIKPLKVGGRTSIEANCCMECRMVAFRY